MGNRHFKGKINIELECYADTKEEALSALLEQAYIHFGGGSVREEDIEITLDRDVSNVPVTQIDSCEKCDGFYVTKKCVKCGHDKLKEELQNEQ